MLTRAYYAIEKSNHIPRAYNTPLWSAAEIGPGYISCKDYTGTVRPVFGCGTITATGGSGGTANHGVLSNWGGVSIVTGSKLTWDGCALQPLESDINPTFEDYVPGNGYCLYSENFVPSNTSYDISQIYDSENDKFVTAISMLYHNASSEEKSIYGVDVICRKSCLYSLTSTSANTYYFLIARQKFDAPLAVESDGYCKITFTWTIDAMGEVEA